MRLINLKIMKTDNPSDEESNLPSRFFPAAGSGHGWFQLEPSSEGFPCRSDLNFALQEWNDDCVLMDYDFDTGRGRFVIVDWYVPPPGTIVPLLGLGPDNLIDDGET